MLEKKKERLALIDGSAVISDALIGVDSTGARSIGCFHSLYSHEPRRVEAADVFGFASERDALYAKRTMLDANCDPDTCLVGHNIVEFDLPKLRMAYLRHGLQLPALPRHHGVEQARKMAKLVVASRVHTGLPVAAGHPSCAVDELFQRHQSAPHQHEAQHAHQQRRRQASTQ